MKTEKFGWLPIHKMINQGQIALFLNGEEPKGLPSLKGYEAVFCADGAYRFFAQSVVKPDLIIGDFDSIEELPTGIQHIHTPDQNFADFEKSIKIIMEKGYTSVDVFAANGLEQDHFLGNLSTALAYKSKVQITFFDDRQTYFFVDKNVKLMNVIGKKISLFPFPLVKEVVSEGLQYPLAGIDLSIANNKVGTRNLALEETVSIRFKEGELLLFVNLENPSERILREVNL